MPIPITGQASPHPRRRTTALGHTSSSRFVSPPHLPVAFNQLQESIDAAAPSSSDSKQEQHAVFQLSPFATPLREHKV